MDYNREIKQVLVKFNKVRASKLSPGRRNIKKKRTL